MLKASSLKLSPLLMLFSALLPGVSAWAGRSPLCESRLQAIRDLRYGRIDQVDSRLVDAGARLPLGESSFAQCATTCFLNLLTKVRRVRGLSSPFKSPFEEMSFILNEFAPRIGVSRDADLRNDGISFTEARKLYKSYLDFLGINCEATLFGLAGSGELTDRKGGFDPDELRGAVKNGEAWLVGVAIIPKDAGGSGRTGYARETRVDDIDWSHALLVVGFDPVLQDRFIFQDPIQKNWQRAGRLKKTWVKERRGFVYQVLFEEHGGRDADSPDDFVFVDSAIRFRF
jgi:hypothetical protein